MCIRDRNTGETGSVPSIAVPQLTPEMEKLRDQLGEMITELIFASQDVAFELAMLECEDKANCPLVKKTKELILCVRKLFEMQKKMVKTAPRVRAYR